MKNFAVTLACIASCAVSPARANDDVVGAMIGAIIGTAISQQGTNASRARPQASSEVRAAQEALNYFGFPAGAEDGLMGRGTRSAISMYQRYLGFRATGELQPHERVFLMNSLSRAYAEPPRIIQAALNSPDGMASLLKRYYGEPSGAGFNEPVPDVSSNASTSVNAAPQNMIIVGQNPVEITDLRQELQELTEQLALLRQVLVHQRSRDHEELGHAARVAALEELIQTYDARISEVEEISVERYSTPIRPENQNLGQTARRVSEIFPKVPYYIAGTDEIGEMWVEPRVTDEGYLQFGFNFIDTQAEYDQIRDELAFDQSEVEQMAVALTKTFEWTEIAQENQLRRNFTRRALCLPENMCDNLRPGITSNEVIFQIYEDGSTSAKIQRNRGEFVSGYNFSIESALLLASYLDYMLEVGVREFQVGTMRDEDLNALFE